MGDRKRVTDELKEYICRNCGRHLTWTLPTAFVLCPSCHTWNNPDKKPAHSEKNEQWTDPQPVLWELNEIK